MSTRSCDQMSLCILTSSYPRFAGETNNAGVFVRDFAKTVANCGLDLWVFTHRKGQPGRYEESFPVHEYRWLGNETSLSSLNLGSPAAWAKAASLMTMGTVSYLLKGRSQKVTYSLAMWAIPSGVFALAAKKCSGVPYAVWALGSDIWRYEQNRLVRPMLRRILAEAEHLFADGEELAQRVTAICGRPCEFLPSARDLSGFNPTVISEERPKPRFLFVGRWETNKAPDVLVEAAARYLEWGGKGSFDLFGEGSLENVLRERIRVHGIGEMVRLHGLIGPCDLVGRLAWCDYLVVPSRIESIPVILSDALQRGVPVLATDVGDMGNILRKQGAGRVVPANAPDILAKAMLDLEHVDAASLAKAAKDTARLFALPAIAERFLEYMGSGLSL